MWEHQQQVMVPAEIKLIWQVVTDVENWKAWDSDVKKAQLSGEFCSGASGEMESADGSRCHFRITEVKMGEFYCNYYIGLWTDNTTPLPVTTI
ncbi:MAG: hypothetical protein GY821_11925 [Gammaproteobacteria bacterium]|nr:hypothetical protein [Gammaproteobacteria bacterium]